MLTFKGEVKARICLVTASTGILASSSVHDLPIGLLLKVPMLFDGALKPGKHGARKMLGKQLADRLFFTGEATGGSRQALVCGALSSGIKIAKKINAILSKTV
jgi:hypothetical protein